jgi:transposase
MAAQTGNTVGVRGLRRFPTRANRLHYTAVAKLLHRAGPRAIFAAACASSLGAIFIFRSKRADRLKIVAWDESGLVTFWKRLEHGAFRGPRSATAQLAALSGQRSRTARVRKSS